ncbi:MAG: hypothetical protein ACI8PQ_002769 [Planctomycetota bacterium]
MANASARGQDNLASIRHTLDMNRAVLIAVLLILGAFGARELSSRLASEEKQIHWMLEEMVEGFDQGKGRQATSGLGPKWAHAGRPVDREQIRGFIIAEAMQANQKDAGDYPWDVDIPEETLRIEVAEDGASANLEAEVIFSILEQTGEDDGRWEPRWHLRLQAELRSTVDGWKIISSSHEDIQGVMLGR